MTKRLLLDSDKRLLMKAFWNVCVRGAISVQRHKQRLKRGEFFPPFLYISITNSCNLRCQGCWADVTAPQQKIEIDAMDRLINEAKAMGNSVFGILGGEPFMHPDLLEILGHHRDCYFQVFTNGHFISDNVAAEMKRLGNISPLVSVEGSETVSDQRRRGSNVLNRTMAGLQACLDQRLVTGVCTSLCQTNFDDLLREQWIDRLIEMGVLYTWFHIYRPVGPDAAPDLCLTSKQQQQARQFVVDMRATKPIFIVDAYYDGAGQGLCPTATGFSHHISPWGDIEPCPIIQLANDSIHDDRPLRETFNQSAFLRDYRETVTHATRGCVVLERPDLLLELASRHDARDTTARGTALEELRAMVPRASQYRPGKEIPERSWAYRLVKHFWFHDYGIYGKHFDARSWRDPEDASP